MKENKLVTLLKSLSAEEFKWFYKFVKSPYYNVNTNLISLYELFRKYYPDFEHPKLSYEMIFSALFPGEDFDIQRLRLLFHRLSNLVESFLVAEQLKADDFLSKKILADSLVRTNTYDLFQKKIEELLKKLDDSPHKDIEYFKNKEQVNLQFYGNPATNRLGKGVNHLTKAMESLDTYFILSKVKLACALGARKQTSSEKNQIKYLDLVLTETEWPNLLVSIYVKILKMQNAESDDLSLYKEVRALYVANLDKLGQEDQRDILRLLLNFCIKLVNAGIPNFANYCMELYKIGLEQGFLLNNDELTEETFTNIVGIGTKIKDFEWVKSFIEQYANNLNDNIRVDTVIYSRAILHFHQNEFSETIQLLSTHTFTKPIKVVMSKAILIRSYVELFLTDNSYYDLSINQINAFERYLRNNNYYPEKTIEGYLNFCRFTKKLLRLKNQGKATMGLKDKVDSAKNLRLKLWLLEKLES
jgi:hypothetical protein